MRVALVSTPFVAVPPRDYGGTELVMYELAEGLVARGHDVTLFATGDSRTSARLEAFFDTPRWPPETVTEWTHLSWALARVQCGGYDVVHCQQPCALAMSRLLPSPPMVYTLHHPREEELSRYYRDYPWIWYVAISDRQRRLEEALPRMAVIHHGIDPAPYAGPTRAGDYVCFIGRLSEVKGPHTAIDVAERAGVEIRVAGAIHGDDDDPGFAEREVRPRLAHRHVRYLGPIGMDQKAPLLRNARALLAPITWEEPFGLTLIEAMVAGCPVVAFPRGAAPELVEPGVTGFLVRDAEEMVEVVRTRLDAFDRERCRARAVARFHRARMVEAYETYYGRAIAAGPRAGALQVTA
ncbi:MAG TPA: glycosyltransferase family 4 protein [Longimicrobiales bacterium]